MKKNYLTLLSLVIGLTLHENVTAQCGVPVNLGTATNMVTLIRNNSSAIAANKALNTITFIHRNNAAAFGGNSGQLRFDISNNGGGTWALNQGVLTPTNTYLSRYPNIAIYNPAANTNTANAFISYMAPTINSTLATFNGIATGVSQFNVTGVTETYNQNGIGTTNLPSSLVTGSVGVFWAIEPLLSTSGFIIYKGVWNNSTSDIVWAVNYSCTPTFNYFPSTVTSDYSIAFDPTGSVGYFCFTAHVSPGPAEASLYPVLYKTTNGGTTWTGPITVDVTKFGCIASNTVSSNYPSMNTNHDMVVDANGNPHIVTTLGNSASYTFNYGLWHHMYDITLKNGLWVAYDLGNVKCGPNTWGGTTQFDQIQAPQASRSADGNKVFFTWTDNSASSLGAANSLPNLFGKGYDIVNSTWTQTKDFTSCNTSANGKIIFPHIAAEALEPTSTSFLIPTMYGEPSVTNDLDQTANFKYLDNVTFSTSEFSISVPAATVTITPPAPLVICPTGSVTLSVGSIAQAIWSNSATTTSISITSGTTTTYSVIAQVGCNVGTASVSVSNLTLASSVLTSSICPGGAANFSVVGNALGYTWTPGGVSGTSVTLNPTSNSVTLTAMGSGSCLTTQTLGLTIFSLPSLTVTGTPSICLGSTITEVVSGAQTYLWSDGTTNATFTDTPAINTTYTVTGTDVNTCVNTTTVSVLVKANPTINVVSNPTVICEGESSFLFATGAVSYSWDAVSSSASNVTVIPTTSTIYTVTGVNSNLCQTTKTVAVTVNALPSITVTPAKTPFCKGEKIKLTASGATSYTWSSPAAITPTVQVNPTNTTTYNVSGTNADGCVSSKIFTLTVSICAGINEQEINSTLLIYPNPNNGTFVIKAESDLILQLVNELGQVVKTLVLNENNSHEISVQDVSAGIYFVSGQVDGKQIKQKIVIMK